MEGDGDGEGVGGINGQGVGEEGSGPGEGEMKGRVGELSLVDGCNEARRHLGGGGGGVWAAEACGDHGFLLVLCLISS